jgi:hypothetical protein
VTIAGNNASVSCDRGLVIVGIANPLKPEIVARGPAQARGRSSAIVDVERHEHPGRASYFTAGGAPDDVHAVRVGKTNASAFACVADAKNDLCVP